jgi:hypothetical protein
MHHQKQRNQFQLSELLVLVCAFFESSANFYHTILSRIVTVSVR